MSSVIFEIILKLAPIFLLMGLGIIIKISKMFSTETIDDFKKLILNISLPAILFFAFMRIDLKLSYFFIFIVIFIVCILLYLIGLLINKIFKLGSDYIPFFMTGFEFGMIGAVFFAAAFGIENIGYIGIIGLGHEFFIWFVFITLLNKKLHGKSDILKTVKNFFTTPAIIAILAGLLFNILNIVKFLEEFFLSKVIFQTMDYLTGLTVPLILIIIGYNLSLNLKILKKGIFVILLRMLFILIFAVLLDLILFKMIFKLDPIFSAALYTFFILPPPFIIPLFINKDKIEELSYINGIIVIYSLLSIIIFSGYFIFYSIYYSQMI